MGQGALGPEAGEDPEGAGALGDAAAEGQIHLAQPQHLGALDQGGVAGGAGRPHRVMGAGDAQTHGDLAGRVVQHGPGIVVMGPVIEVEVVLADVVDLVLGLHRAVFGQPHVNPDPVAVPDFDIDTGIGQGLVGGIDPQAAGPGAAFVFLFLAVFGLGKVADPGRHLADIAQLDFADAADPGQQPGSEIGEVVGIGRGQADAGDDDAGGNFIHAFLFPKVPPR